MPAPDGQRVPILPLVASAQPLEDEGERRRGRLARPLRFAYGIGGVQDLVHTLRALVDPLPVLDRERQPQDGLEGGQGGEDEDGHQHAV